MVTPNLGTGDADEPLRSTAVVEPVTDPQPAPVGLRERLTRAAAQLRVPAGADSVAETVSPHVAAADAPAPGPIVVVAPAHWPAYIRVSLALVVGFAGSLLLAGTAPVWYLAPVSWRLTVPGLLSPGDPLYSAVTFVLAVSLLCLGWVGLVGHTRRATGSSRSRLTWVLIAAVAWSLPILAGPIQLSTDAYSYAAQGALAEMGLDPTSMGPNALPNHSTNEFWRAADPVWRDAAAPYGPVAIGLAEATVVVTGYNVTNAALGFRALALAGVIMTGIGVFVIARNRRVSPPLALALAVANPVVLIHLIGGAHNDALMMGLLVLGMAAFERSRKILAVVLIALAVSVKLPAIIALAFIAWNWTAPDAAWKQRVRDFAVVGGITAGMIALLSVVAGIGIGWLLALQNTGTVYSTFAVFTKLGFLTSDLLNAVGIEVDPESVVNVVRLLGLVVATGLILVLMVKSPRIGVTKSVGLALLVFVLCSPVLWPWYLPAAFALLAASGLGRFRPSLIVLVVSSSLLVWPTSVNSVASLTAYQHWLGFGVGVLIAAACLAAQYLAVRIERYRAEHGTPPLLSGSPDEDPDVVPVVARSELVSAR